MSGLFAEDDGTERLGDGIILWRDAVDAPRYVADIARISAEAPFRFMRTPGGQPMSVAMTNCGPYGWISDAEGYRYSDADPDTGMPWPEMPVHWKRDAAEAARRLGHPGFEPDACLINRYVVGARMSAHQDRDEADLGHPVVSVSLGLEARFVFHGPTRDGPARSLILNNGDVLAWGGPARMHFHAVRPITAGQHPLTGALRYNLTFRRARP